MARIAVVSDIHGNLTAFEAVLEDLRLTAPDVIFHGGDLADGGSGPVEIIDRIRELGWPGVMGNTDEMLFRPESFTSMPVVQEMAVWTREKLGEERLSWMRALPLRQDHKSMGLVHASPQSCWQGPPPSASDEELEAVFSSLGKPVAVYGHVHHPFVRRMGRLTVANSGMVSLPFDGDPRASYLLIDDETPTVRRVEYDIDREQKALAACGIPHADWVGSILVNARPPAP